MTFTTKDFDEIVTELKINLVNNVDEITDLNVGSVIETVISTFASSIEGLYEDLDTVYDGTRITTAIGDDLEELGLIVGVERDEGSYASGYVTFEVTSPLSSNMTIPLNSQVSTQPNTSETQYVYNVNTATTFQAAVTGEEQEFINGIYDYKLNQRFLSSITSLTGTSGSVAYTFTEDTEFEVVEDFEGDIIDVDDYEAFNLCEAITGWTEGDDADAVATDAVTYYEGTKSLQLSNSSGTTLSYVYDIGDGNEIDIDDKSLFMRLYVKDAATLAKITSVELEYSSEDLETSSTGVSCTYTASDLHSADEDGYTGWNQLKVDSTDSSSTTTGNADTENIRYLKITVVVTSTISSGDLNMDNWIFSTYTDYEGDIIRFDYTSSDLPDTTTDISVSYIPLSWEVPITAANVGDDYNVAEGMINYKVSSFPLIRTIYNYEVLTGGIDEESDDTLRTNIYNASELTNVATANAIESNVLALNYVKTCTVDDLPEEYVELESHVYDDTSKKFQLNRYVPLDDATLAVFETYSLLDGAITDSDSTITVDSASSFDASGTIQIDGELITYTGKTATDFTGCSRGAAGTDAAAHVDDSVVSQYEYINGTDYDLNTDYEIVFDGTEPSDGNTVYANYTREKLGYFDVYVTGLYGSLNSSQVSNITSYVDTYLKSAGIQFEVTQPTYMTMDVDLTITYDTGYSESLLEDDIEDAVSDYINDLDLGDDVLVAKIVSAVMGITGVGNVILTDLRETTDVVGGTTDYTIDSDEKAIMGTLTLA